MANKNLQKFLHESKLKVEDEQHRKTINFNMSKYYTAVDKGKHQYSDHNLARSRASYYKSQAIDNLDKLLIEFERNFEANGGKVLWASDKDEAIDYFHEIIKKHKVKLAVKSKSMTTEEIELNDFLEDVGVEPVETDLGEYIVQLAGEKPYHIVTPAMHKSKKDIAQLFHEKLDYPLTDDATELTLLARRLLREKYVTADIGITGGNFILPDLGGIAITENEGNGRLVTSAPRVHVAIVGIEKVIPSSDHIGMFWPLLSTSGTGQKVTVYNSILRGPRKSDELDGPEHMYVILLDNGRTNLLAKEDKRQALNCIRCGACLNACPVYKNIGGHTYSSTYQGPIGSVITPHYNGMEDFKHLSFASSLCGACTEVCPVKINIHEILLLNRNESVKEGLSDKSEKQMMKLFKYSMKRRWVMNFVGGKTKNFFLQRFFSSVWGDNRKFPKVPAKSFNERWKAREKK